MLFYQIVIMLAVVLLICLLAYVIKIKRRLILAVLLLVVASLGAGGLCLVQYLFSSHFYVQSVDVNALKNLKFTTAQRESIGTVFAGYRPVSDTNAICVSALSKTYKVKKSGATSEVTVTVYTFAGDAPAEQFFDLSQKFYENRNFLPPDGKRSLNVKGQKHRYVTSYIKSAYPSYTDFIYLPSKIEYFSEALVLDNDVIVSIRERSDKPVANKNEVIGELLTTLGDAA